MGAHFKFVVGNAVLIHQAAICVNSAHSDFGQFSCGFWNILPKDYFYLAS